MIPSDFVTLTKSVSQYLAEQLRRGDETAGK